ncbi:hypothetical protein D918_06133 [Trichuris suis]|nr:hypothetical protein D918_06133 [Trichuris suis]
MPSLPYISGCGGASRSGRLLTPIGLADLDALIGGGMSVGDLCLVGHPDGSAFVRHLREAYAKEGTSYGHGLYHAQALQSCSIKCTVFAAGENALAGQYFRCFSPSAGTPGDDDRFSSLLEDLGRVLSEEPFSMASGGRKNVLRVLVDDLGSMVWCSPDKLAGYIARLRAQLRHSYACGLLMTPFSSSKALKDAAYFCDVLLAVDEFNGSSLTVNPCFSNYDGILKIQKLSSSNQVAQSFAPFLNYGFKKKKGRISIEPLHMPPTLDDSGLGCQAFLNF